MAEQSSGGGGAGEVDGRWTQRRSCQRWRHQQGPECCAVAEGHCRPASTDGHAGPPSPPWPRRRLLGGSAELNPSGDQRGVAGRPGPWGCGQHSSAPVCSQLSPPHCPSAGEHHLGRCIRPRPTPPLTALTAGPRRTRVSKRCLEEQRRWTGEGAQSAADDSAPGRSRDRPTSRAQSRAVSAQVGAVEVRSVDHVALCSTVQPALTHTPVGRKVTFAMVGP